MKESIYMGSSMTTLFGRFSPAADQTIIAVSVVMVILMLFSYVSRSRSLRIFLTIVISLVLAALTDVSWNMIVRMKDPSLYTLGYVFREVYHAMLYLVFFLYGFYIADVTGLEAKKQRLVVWVTGTTAAVFIILEILLAFCPNGFRILEDGTVQQGFNLFLIGYIIFTIELVFLLYKVRGYLYRRVMYGFYASVAVAYVMMIIQQIFGHSSPSITLRYIGINDDIIEKSLEDFYI